jgi:hypothetical protein
MFATQEKPIQITASLSDSHQAILSEGAQRFLARLARAFEPRRRPNYWPTAAPGRRRSTPEPCRSSWPPRRTYGSRASGRWRRFRRT